MYYCYLYYSRYIFVLYKIVSIYTFSFVLRKDKPATRREYLEKNEREAFENDVKVRRYMRKLNPFDQYVVEDLNI